MGREGSQEGAISERKHATAMFVTIDHEGGARRTGLSLGLLRQSQLLQVWQSV